MNQRNDKDKKVLGVVAELSVFLKEHKYDEAWEKAGELSALIKSREELSLPDYMIDMLQQHLKKFYYQNSVIKKARKAQSAVGHKLEEFK